MTYGEKRRVVAFNLDRPTERVLYELSSQLNFSNFVKRHLMEEARQRALLGKSEITVEVGEQEQ